VSGLAAFLAADGGVGSGFVIAQYAAVSLVAENRRLAAPASLDAGVTSALQEDHLSHATPAATKALAIIDNAVQILAIELLAAAQAYEFQEHATKRVRGTDVLDRAVRAATRPYADDRPLAHDMRASYEFLHTTSSATS
jgi:histidine ammonia-lyase